MSFWDFITGATGIPTQVPASLCTASADAGQTKVLQQNQQLAASWKVNRLYYRADLQNIWAATMKTIGDAGAQGNKAMAALSGDMGGIKAQLAKLVSVAVDGVKFSTSNIDALAKGVKVIDAPDFKAWVLGAAAEAAKMQWWIAYTQCRQPAIYFLLSAIGAAVSVLIQIVEAVVEAVIEVGETIISVASGFTAIIPYLKWGAIIAGGAFFVYKGKQLYDKHQLTAGGGS